jgi:eukaryotic-like serine/threonine-protein kinase
MDTDPTTNTGPAARQETLGESTSTQALVQERVALFTLACTLLGLTLLAFRVVTALAAGRLTLTHPSMLLHGVGLLSFIAIWLIARRGSYSARVVRGLENTAIILTCGLFTAVPIALPIALRPDYVLILSLLLIVMTRSILVPSTARRTAIIVVLVGVLVVAGSYIAVLGADLSALPPMIRRELRPVLTAFRSGAWWLLTAGLAVTTSHVIYGLRREIHEARRLGQYALEEKLGEGGMGVVYRASHAMLRRPTAVKLLAPEKAGLETIARFEREVRLTARLTHPNTITIYDYGRTPEGIFYYAMELLDGATLEEVVEVGGAFPAGRVVHVGGQIASALVEAHGVGLIHRDIKPANVILCERGGVSDVVKVVDFGLVRELDAANPALSRAGTVSGTPLYLAPEAIRTPDQVDARADLYALGGVLYYLLAGDHVFHGRTTVEVCAHHLHSEPPPVAERARGPLPEDLARLVMACLKKDPAERPQSAAELLDRLRACSVAGAWTEQAARAWWAANGEKLRAHHASHPSSAASTIAVDLQRR